MTAELTKTYRRSRSESGDADVRKRKELSGNEEVLLWLLLIVTLSYKLLYKLLAKSMGEGKF